MQRIVRDALAGRDLSAAWMETDVAAGNAERIEAARASSIDDLLVAHRRQQTRTLALWELLTERHLQAILPHWAGGFWTVREYILAFPAHDRTHIDQIRAAVAA